MLFTKFFVPVLAIFGVASTVLGSPVAAPEPVAVAETRSEIEARQLPDLTGILTQLENTIGPILSQIESTALSGGTSSELTGLLTELTSALSTATSALNALPGASVALGSATAVISVVVSVLLSLVTTLGGLPLVNLVLNAQVNTFLSSFLVALERVVPGSAGSIGSSIPSTATGLFNILGLGTILSLLGLLGAL